MLGQIVALAALLLAVLALAHARRASRRLERLTESYWELRYEHGQLRARLARLEGSATADPPMASSSAPTTSFIPLTSLKR